MNTHVLCLYYMLLINALTFFLYGIDKFKAIKSKWRIPEKTLISVAVIGGSIGALAGMMLFRHKTLHKKFTFGIPLILLLQIGIAAYFFLNG